MLAPHGMSNVSATPSEGTSTGYSHARPRFEIAEDSQRPVWC